jgi:signal transduction histidine kinase
LALLIVTAAGAGILTYRFAHFGVLEAEGRELSVIAHLKSEQIERWIDERRRDVLIVAGSPLFRSQLHAWLAGGQQDSALGERLLGHLRELATTADFAHYCLRSASDGAPLLTLDCHADSPAIRTMAMNAARRNVTLIEDFHPSEDDPMRIDLGLFTPIDPGLGKHAGVVAHVTLDPEHTLFPPLLKWPGASTSAETLLVRRDGDNVQFLGSLRHRPDPPMTLRVPMTDTELLATQALTGKIGFVSGHDYRGVPSFGHVMPVPGTSWYLVTKIDKAETEAWLEPVAYAAGVAILLLTAISVWWETERQRHLGSLRAAELQTLQAVREREERLAALSHRLLSVQEDERRRLSAELHDRTSPNLAALDMNLRTVVRRLPAASADSLSMLLDDIRALLDDTVASIREVCAELRPPILDYAGLVPALESYAQQLRGRTGLDIQVLCPQPWLRLTAEIESTLYRIAQESLTNSIRHARSRKVVVTVNRHGGDVMLEIADDGVGFVIEALGSPGTVPGLGLINMRERAMFVGGRFQVSSVVGLGTRITVTIPLANDPAAHSVPPLDVQSVTDAAPTIPT